MLTDGPVNVCLSFRTVRIGTLKTYSLSEKDVLKFDSKRLKFAVRLRQENRDQNEILKVVIPCKHITFVKSYLGRGCPVIWLQTSEECTRHLQKTMGMKKGRIPTSFYDPWSKVVAERYVGIIAAEDPIPYHDVFLLKQVVQKIFQDRNIQEEDFHGKITQAQCNAMLVEVTNIADKITTFQQKCSSQPDIDIGKCLYEGIKYSSSLITEEPPGLREYFSQDRLKSNRVQAFCDYFLLTARTEFVAQAGSYTQKSITQDGSCYQGVKLTVQDVEAHKSLLRKSELEAESHPKTDYVRTSAPKNHHVQVTVSSPSSTQKNMNRARKSIPKSNRNISLESQLDEIRAKAGLHSQSKQTGIVTMENIEHNLNGNLGADDMPQENVSDDTGNSSSASMTVAKKKRPKDPFLWKGRGKRRVKKSTNHQMVHGAHELGSVKFGHMRKTPLLTMSATSEDKMDSTYLNQVAKEAHENLVGRHATTGLCSCLEGSPYIVITGSDTIKCMGFDNVDGRLTACIEAVQSPLMMKASQHVPALALCDMHRERMYRHECCPGCGMFCAGGTFLICMDKKDCPHRFHKDCMLLHCQTKDCLHCGGPMSQVREINIDPCQDYKLRWVIAGHDPVKMERKRLMAGREKTARMGYKTMAQKIPVEDGIVKIVRHGVTISTSSLPSGKARETLEEALCSSFDTSKKTKIPPKSICQFVQQGDIVKLVQFFIEAEEHEVCNALKMSSILNKAVEHGNTPAVFFLILMGSKPNTKDSKGKSALFYAEEIQNVDLIEFLVANEADITSKDSEGMTCFHQAAKHGRIVSCASLLLHNPDIINLVDEGGWTPILWAAEHGSTTTAKFLEYFGADINKTVEEVNVCLHWAALSGNLDLLLLCLKKHCNFNARNQLGDTALHIAARRNHCSCVICLVGWGADHRLRNNDGKIPLELAQPESMSCLLLKFKMKVGKTMSGHEAAERVMSSDLSGGFENLPVSCVNDVDNAPCPTDPPDGFKYVIANVHTSQETIIRNPASKMQSCQCFAHCVNDTCLCCLLSERCWYDEDGLLVPEFDMLEPPLVFECSETCWCPPSCRNRVVQKGIRFNLQIHRTRAMGWSVRTLDTIPRGAFVCEYVGELISDAEADIREDDSYLFDLENKDGEIFCIDARYYGNVSRFINHLCNPNLVPIRVFIDHHDIRFPRLAYFSTTEIQAGEELGFDYGDRFWDVKCRQFTCGCGLPQCKYSKEAYRLKKELEEKTRDPDQVEKGEV